MIHKKTQLKLRILGVKVRVMIFNSTFNNISVILWRSVLLVEETRVPRENHLKSLTNLSHVVSSTPWLSRIQTHTVSGDRQRHS